MRTRKRKEWFPKDCDFVCGKCGAKGDCGDRNSKDPIFWDEDEEKITCRKCGHQLTSKKELQEKLTIEEVQLYGFWLRFLSEHFIPCKQCQKRLGKIFDLLTKMSIDFCNPCCVRLRAYKNANDQPEFYFAMAFINPTELTSYKFEPCEDCQGKLWKLYSKKEMHIGNDEKPLVELWRKWHHIDELRNL